jgi:hypothetical protein
VVARSSLRVELSAEYSQAIDTLERVVRFARALEELGLEVRIAGELGVVVEAAIASDVVTVGMDELLEARVGSGGSPVELPR